MSDKLKNITNYLKQSNDYRYKDQLIEKLKKLNKNKISIFSDDLLSDILKIAIDNNIDCSPVISRASNLYKIMLFDEKDILKRNLFLEYLSLMVSKDITSSEIYKLDNIYGLFNDKKLLLGLYKSLNDMDNLDKINSYLLESRRYYVDETAFYAQALNIVNIINNNENEVEIEKLIKKEIEKDKQLAGIYDIDVEKILNSINKTIYNEEIITDKLNKVTTLLNIYFNNGFKDDNVELLHEIKEYIETLENQITLLKNGTKDNETIKLLEEKIDTLIDKINKKESNDSSKNKMEEINNIDEKDHFNQFIEYVLFRIRKYLDENVCDITIVNSDINHKVREKIKENIKIDKSKEGIAAYSISKNSLNYLYRYYWALYNDNETLFEKVINVGNGIDFKYFRKNISNKFDLNTYVDLIYNKRAMLDTFMYHDKIDTLVTILKLNPNFYLDADQPIKDIDQIISIFGIDVIARISKSLTTSLINISEKEYTRLKEAYDINNNICIIEKGMLIENIIFSLEELANLTELQQRKMYNLLGEYYSISYPTSMNEFYKNQIRKIVLSEKPVYCCSRSYKKLLDDLLYKNIDIDTYLSFDYDEQELILRNNKRKTKKLINQFNYKNKKVQS